MDSLRDLTTEARNPASMNLDELSSSEIVRLMNELDAGVAAAVATQGAAISAAVDAIAARLQAGGRLIYMGAGTSGRLGVLDAAECPPTFNSLPGQVLGLIAGGYDALTRAVEGAEDHPELAERDLAAVQAGPDDVVVGIATSGRTPYVVGGLEQARRLGCFTIAIACNADASISGVAHLSITPVVGPEVLSGSTRLKAGTATKLVLNMLSTGAMVRIGKTFGNLMVDLRATNSKLRDRARRIVETIVGLDEPAADLLLAQCAGELKTTIVAGRVRCSPEEARERLRSAAGQVRQAIAATHVPPCAPPLDNHRRPEDLVLGIDGGGSSTVALLAEIVTGPSLGAIRIVGRGQSGPSNPQVVGWDRAFGAIRSAIHSAFTAAGCRQGPVKSACIGLAGAGRPADRAKVVEWTKYGLASTREARVESDVDLVLAAGTPRGWGLAVIAGTGSLALAVSPDGIRSRAGGWGYLLGDEGSAFDIASAGLRAVAQAFDRRGPDTALTEALAARLGVAQPEQLVAVVYGAGIDRTAIAALAPVVTRVSEQGDPVARSIVARAAVELGKAALASVKSALRNELSGPIPMALAGSVLIECDAIQRGLMEYLRGEGLRLDPIQHVTEPALGALQLALAALR